MIEVPESEIQEESSLYGTEIIQSPDGFIKLKSNQFNEEKIPTAQLELGNSYESEFSNEYKQSERGQVILSSWTTPKNKIEHDLEGNLIIQAGKDIIKRGKDLFETLDNKNISIKDADVLECLKQIVSAGETILHKTVRYNVVADVIKLSAKDSIILDSPNVQFGINISDNNETGDNGEENLKYDSIMTENKFKKWYLKVLKPFVEKVNNHMDKYNGHFHVIPTGFTGNVVETGGNVTQFEEVNNKAKTPEKLTASISGKTI